MPDIPDDVRRRVWLDNVRDFVARKAGEIGSATVEKAQEVARGYAGNPGTPYGEVMNRVMAAGRSLVPGRGTYGEELQRVKEAREEEYPGAYSVVKPLRDKALSQSLADDMTSNAMGMASPIAFHGSPHVFPKFDLSKVGTGEGNQAYGHGLYFTSEPKIAEQYRSGLTASKTKFKVSDEEATVEVARRLRDAANRLRAEAETEPDSGKWSQAQIAARNAEQQAEHMERMVKSPMSYQSAIRPYDAEIIAREYGGGKVAVDDLVEKPEGAFYEVDLPDNLLDYDKPLSEQPEAVRALQDGGIIELETEGRSKPALVLNAPGHSLDGARVSEWSGSQILRALSSVAEAAGSEAPGQSAASTLKSAGLPGHRYKGDSSGVENYVIYDDQQIKPLGRFPNLTEYLRSKQSPNQ